MARKTKRSMQLHHARECKKLKSLAEPEPDADHSDSQGDDFYFSNDEVLTDKEIDSSTTSFLKWIPGAGSHLRNSYSKNSTTTLWRRKKANQAKIDSSSNNHKILEYFSSCVRQTTNGQSVCDGLSSDSESENGKDVSGHSALKLLEDLTAFNCSQTIEKSLKDISKYDYLRYHAIKQYLTLRQNSITMMQASKQVASQFFPNNNADSYSRKIRRWASFFLRHQKLPCHRQGCFIKVKSLVNDEDVAKECMIWLRSQRNDAVSGLSFSQWVKAELHVRLKMGNPVTISERTATRWLNTLGLRFGGYKKGLYNDGHEREDVVIYRESFLSRMDVYDRRMAKFEGDELMNIVEPTLAPGEKKLILLTHDESCFSSYDGKKTIWIDDNHMPLRPKGEGRSVMVSEFLCECHGPLKLDDEQQAQNPGVPIESVVIIKPGKNSDGYWTNADLAKQLGDKVLPIFRILHPNCQALVLFDNSQNHHALPPDALNAKVLTVKDGGKNIRSQRNGWFIQEGQKVTQPMQDDQGVQKGLRTILTERGLWNNSMSLAGARALLQEQPDFQEQREWLTEIVEQSGGIIDYYPKFHCEMNFIEMFWAACKSFTRKNCTYSFRDLVKIVPIALSSVSLTQIRRFARKCYRYIDAYRVTGQDGNKLSPRQVEFAVKKHKRHRSLLKRMLEDLQI